MNEDKKINTSDLPQKWERTTTQQPEEFIDQKSTEKDPTDTSGQESSRSTTRRAEGDQESGN